MLIPFSELFAKYNIKPTGILHLGANTGQEAEEYLKLGIPYVIWVEAIPKVYKQLVEHVKQFPNTLSVLNACVSNVDGKKVIFNISNNESQSSSFLELGVHRQAHPEVHYVEQIQLTTTRIDTLLSERILTGDWLLNADLQGAELLAFKGIGALMDRFQWIYTEVNSQYTYKDCALIGEIDEYLSQYNFSRVETGNWVGGCWTDALYSRSS